MNRRKFLQALSAVVPAWLLAKFVKPDDIRVLYVDDVAAGQQTTIACTEPPCKIYFMGDNGWEAFGEVREPIVHVRMDANDYHVYRNGETFTLTVEGFVKA